MQRIRIIDSHTGGEPTRLVIGGFPDLGQGDMAERRRLLGERHDAWRAACILEPRAATYWSAPCSAHRSIPKPVPE